MLLVLFIGLPLFVVAYVIIRYSDSARDVRRVVDSIPEAEKPIPPLAVAVFQRLYTSTQRGSLVFQVLNEKLHSDGEDGPQMRNLERHLRGGVSWLLTPLRISDADQAVLVWNRTYFGTGGHGLWFGAQKYFGKDPRELSADEMIRLWVIAQSPKRYDENPSKFDELFSWATRIWRGEEQLGTREKFRNSGG